MLNKKKKEFVDYNMIAFTWKANFNLENIASNFMLIKLKKIFLNWNIKFFNYLYLSKNKINMWKFYINKNNYLFFYKDLNNLLNFFKFNKIFFKKFLNVQNFLYKGFFLNYKIFYKLNFSQKILSNLFINFFLQGLIFLLLNLLFNTIFKIIFYIKYNFKNCISCNKI